MKNLRLSLLRPWLSLLALALGILAYPHLAGNKAHEKAKMTLTVRRLVIPTRAARSKQDAEAAATADLAKLLDETKWGISKDRKANDQRWISLLQRFIANHAGSEAAGMAAIEASQAFHRIGQDDVAMAALDDLVAKYKGSVIEPRAVVAKGDLFQRMGRIDESIALLTSVAGRFRGTVEASSAKLSLAWAYSLQGHLERAKAICAAVAGDPSAGETNRWRAAYKPIQMDVHVLHGGKLLAKDGAAVSLSLEQSNALLDQTIAHYAALVERLRSGPSASMSKEAKLMAQTQTDIDLANQATFDYGLLLYGYERYQDAADQFSSLAQSPTAGDYANPSLIALGSAQFYLGQCGAAITTEQAALADPNIDATDIDSANGWLHAAQSRLGLIPLPEDPSPPANPPVLALVVSPRTPLMDAKGGLK